MKNVFKSNILYLFDLNAWGGLSKCVLFKIYNFQKTKKTERNYAQEIYALYRKCQSLYKTCQSVGCEILNKIA